MSTPTFILTGEQAEKLRQRLEGTAANVYSVAAALFGAAVAVQLEHDERESVFDQLECHGIFRCEECSRWLPDDERVDWTDPKVRLCTRCE